MIARPMALADIPQAVFEGAPFQSAAPWWRAVLAAALPADSTPRLLLAGDAAVPGGMLPLLVKGRSLTTLTTPYTCLFQPPLASGADAAAAGEAFARACAPHAVLRCDALDPDWPGWAALLAGFAAAGWHGAWFDAFGNWYETALADWPAYLAARPGALRETIRRKLPRAERRNAFRLARHPGEIATALADYETVYRSSWKAPEPFPHFNAALLGEAAAAGLLRLGTMDDEAGKPVAAQYWIVERGTATILKLAHDEAARALSPGTVLTAWMIRGLLADGITSLDFGRGDDAYKRLWAGRRRQRKGLILARPLHPLGAAALARQALGRLRRRLSPA